MELTLDQILQKAIEAHKAGRLQEADRYYNEILKVNSKHPHANHNMGVLVVSTGRVQDALPFFQTALEAEPTIAQYWLTYTDALVKLERMDEAKDVLDQAKRKGVQGISFDQIEKTLVSASSNNIDADGSSEEELNFLINLYNQKQFRKVLNEAQILTKRYTKSLTIWNIIGVSAAQIGQYKDAIRAFQTAISIKPDYADAYNNMGNALKDLGSLEEAIRAFNKAISIKPDYADALYNMGNALKDLGRLEEAIRAFSKAISIKPDYADAYNNMGNALKDLGRLEEAIQAFDKAISIKPDYADAYNNMGVILKDLGRLEEAIKFFNKALSIKPDYADASYNMGNALKDLGRLEEAIQAFNKALSIKPDYADAYNNMGVTLTDLGRLEEAIQAFNKALSIKPDYADALVNALSLRNQISNTPLIKEGFEKKLEIRTLELCEKPKYQIHWALGAFLINDQKSVRQKLEIYNGCSKSLIAKLTSKDKVFCSAYNHFLKELIKRPLVNEPTLSKKQTVFHLGESHCLSYAHRKIKIHGMDYTVEPRITFGGKAYHFSEEKENSFKAITKANFYSLPAVSKVFLSFGEIDCRQNEGFIYAAAKIKKPIEELVSDTVRGYVDWFLKINSSRNHILFFLNVPAPVYNEEYSVVVNKEVMNTIKLFNNLLNKAVLKYDLNIIDVHKFTVGNNGFSNGFFHIDNRHLSSDAIPQIEQQLSN